MGNAFVVDLAGRLVGNVDPVHPYPAPGHAPQAGNRLDEFFLAVAGHTGDAENFVFIHIKGNPPDHGIPLVAVNKKIADVQDFFLSRKGGPGEGENDVATDHHAGHGAFVQRMGIGIAHNRSLAQHRYPIAKLFDLIELMADENDHFPVISHLLQDLKKIAGFLRREDRCGLVQDEKPGAIDQGLDNFDPLLFTGRKLPYFFVRIDIEVELFRKFNDSLAKFFLGKQRR